MLVKKIFIVLNVILSIVCGVIQSNDINSKNFLSIYSLFYLLTGLSFLLYYQTYTTRMHIALYQASNLGLYTLYVLLDDRYQLNVNLLVDFNVYCNQIYSICMMFVGFRHVFKMYKLNNPVVNNQVVNNQVGNNQVVNNQVGEIHDGVNYQAGDNHQGDNHQGDNNYEIQIEGA